MQKRGNNHSDTGNPGNKIRALWRGNKEHLGDVFQIKTFVVSTAGFCHEVVCTDTN